MKNSFINFQIFLIFIYCFFSFTNIFAKDLNFKALEILTYDKGNIVVGKKEAEAKIDDELEIYADKFTYNKETEILIAEGNVKAIDLLNKIVLNSNKVSYNKVKNKIISYDKTKIDVNEKYKIDSEDINFLVNEAIVSSNKKTFLIDNSNNNIELLSFKYFNNTEIIKGTGIKILDNEENTYFLDKGMLKLSDYILLGKDIKVYLRNDSFGNTENEPKIKGNSIYYKNDKTLITKGVFTSCKENDNCPPWKITSKKIIHDKKERQINYHNAWLKIYNVPVMYFPKFFHPDPSVDRKSGFLIPQLNNSNKLGSSLTIPYFNVISESSDLTFKPRIFSDNEFLLQSEYRKETKNSSHIIDFSFNNDQSISNDTRTHFFSNSNFSLENEFFDDASLFLKLEKISNDNYASIYNLEGTSPIIKDTSTLESTIEFSGEKNDFFIDISGEVYERMNVNNSDKYEFIYPNYALSKVYDLEGDYFNNYEVISSGHQKKYSTNIYELSQVNDILISSNSFILNDTLNSNFRSLFKNVNTKSKNSGTYKEQTQSEILSNFIYDISLPLKKAERKFTKFLTPKISMRYSPNNTKNIQTSDSRLNIDNIFSINRIGTNDDIESGTSLTIGSEFLVKNKNNLDFLSFDIGSVFRKRENENLPSNSTLRNSQSDIVGNLTLSGIENWSVDYDFSADNDLETINLHSLKNTFKVNNFIHTFEFYEENNSLGDNSYYSNNLTYEVNKNNFFSYRTRRNNKTNLTEFYNLIYQYKNDCLIASVNYNKEYYSNNALEPSENLFFNITLIPLGSTQTDNVINK
jgi:LPS-assembly protein